MKVNGEKGLRRLAWGLAGLALVFFVVGLVLQARIPLERLGAHPANWPVDPIHLGLLSYVALGALIVLRRPRNLIGWIFLAIGLFWEIFGLTEAYVVYTKLATPGVSLISPWLLWLPSMMWLLGYGLTPLLLFLFPTGRLLSPRWQVALWAFPLGLISGITAFGSDLSAGSYHYYQPSLTTLLGVPWLNDLLGGIVTMIYLGLMLAGAAAVVIRLVRSRGEERLQMKWFTYAGVVAIAINLAEDLFFDQLVRLDPSAQEPASLFLGIPAALSLVIIAAAAAVAVLRYRLYEIDVIIRKTLIYATLTAVLALVYAGAVIALESILRLLTGQGQSDAVIVVSTLAIATLFSPLRGRIQDWIDQRFFRRRYNTDQVLAAFYATARDEVDLERMSDKFLNVVAETIQPSRVALWLVKKS